MSVLCSLVVDIYIFFDREVWVCVKKTRKGEIVYLWRYYLHWRVAKRCMQNVIDAKSCMGSVHLLRSSIRVEPCKWGCKWGCIWLYGLQSQMSAQGCRRNKVEMVVVTNGECDPGLGRRMERETGECASKCMGVLCGEERGMNGKK